MGIWVISHNFSVPSLDSLLPFDKTRECNYAGRCIFGVTRITKLVVTYVDHRLAGHRYIIWRFQTHQRTRPRLEEPEQFFFMQPVLQNILVVGGNGFIGLFLCLKSACRPRTLFATGSAVCKAALARGIKVTSIRFDPTV